VNWYWLLGLFPVGGLAAWVLQLLNACVVGTLGYRHANATAGAGAFSCGASVPVALTRTSKKRQALLDAGAAYVIATQKQDLVTEVNRITDGKGARMAFDPVGGAEVANILRSLSTRGIFLPVRRS